MILALIPILFGAVFGLLIADATVNHLNPKIVKGVYRNSEVYAIRVGFIYHRFLDLKSTKDCKYAWSKNSKFFSDSISLNLQTVQDVFTNVLEKKPVNTFSYKVLSKKELKK